MTKRREVYVVVDTGTPESPVVAVYDSYQVAEYQAAKLTASTGDNGFIVSTHEVQSEGTL
jgi:hypothetical protein